MSICKYEQNLRRYLDVYVLNILSCSCVIVIAFICAFGVYIKCYTFRIGKILVLSNGLNSGNPQNIAAVSAIK